MTLIGSSGKCSTSVCPIVEQFESLLLQPDPAPLHRAEILPATSYRPDRHPVPSHHGVKKSGITLELTLVSHTASAKKRKEIEFLISKLPKRDETILGNAMKTSEAPNRQGFMRQHPGQWRPTACRPFPKTGKTSSQSE
jgi:hypothetical protein